MSAERLAAQLLEEADVGFVRALQAAGLFAELDSDELLLLASELSEPDEDRRWVDLLEGYYGDGADAERGSRRRSADGFFLQRLGEPATAAGLVGRLSALFPALGAVALERIGGDDGPLVVRAGEHFCAVLEDADENLDTDQVDLSDLEDDDGPPMVTVRGLVRAINVLLDRHGERERLMSLRGDEEREVYVRLGITEAMTLAREGYLEDDDPEDVMELGAW